MKLKDLKKGDKINNIEYGGGIFSAKVIENFPDKEKIYLKLKPGLFSGIFKVFNYSEYNFNLIRD